jgi:diguanylate cyclase (GGDEF)-like protein
LDKAMPSVLAKLVGRQGNALKQNESGPAVERAVSSRLMLTMLGKIRIASGLLCVLIVFCVLQLVTEAMGFWSLELTHDDVSDLSNVALKQINAANETTRHLMDARINLSRAGTRMMRGGAEPATIVRYAREQLAAADRSFGTFMHAAKIENENNTRATALAASYLGLRAALTELAQDLDDGHLQAFLDQPTQSSQDAYLAELHNLVQFNDEASRASLHSIDTRLVLFRQVGFTILLLLLVGTVTAYAALRRGVVSPLEEVGRHFDSIAQGQLDQPVAEYGSNEIGRLFTALGRMQDELKRARDALSHLALIDGLTGLTNRRHFDETHDLACRMMMRTGQPLSIIMIDLDHFKDFNDHYGHLAGDECLREVAGVLRGTLLRATELVSRYGGEEFVCILQNTPHDEAVAVAGRIRANLAERNIAHAASPTCGHVTISIGVATATGGENLTGETLLARADRLLYMAKERGRNQIAA